MKYYLATVLSKGKKVQHGFYADGKKEAMYIAKVRYPGIVVNVMEGAAPLDDQLKHFKERFMGNIKKKKVKPDSLIAAIRQLAVMTNAGISVHDALNEIARAANDPVLEEIFSSVAEDINSGSSMSKSMENFRFQLGGLTLAMVELGEQTGNMADSLYQLADMLEEIRRNVIKFKKAMAYPRNVMIAMAVAFTILISYVVPQFKKIFEELHADLPLPTIILLKLEYLFNNFGPYILAGLIVFFIIFRYMLNTNREFKFRWHQLLLKTYLIKDLIMFSTLNRFTLVFSALVKAGIPIADALETSVAMIDNLPLQEKLLTVRQAVEKGASLSEGLADTGLFENMIIQMISAGEQGGQLDSMLEKVTDYYKMRFDQIIDGLAEAIEPIMLFIIAAMVLLLALGIFLPMWSLNDAVHGR
ncbi:type II secretion system F family protein [Sulfurimonas sp. HSL-3221]|uniref:type II secretion system F family protein n=1 Tax=Sulfurimonadaceae TaxID=2771471 RepID=UPI001E5AB0E1|nr:type II secretion system F family protein [Sulfurimonas sp. HSL-3221]UFS63191.1 type II secretion system F family protein [Sulfurimonas sp. HSL-3221]